MFQYEMFRQTVVGWLLIFSFLLIGYPYINLQQYTLIYWSFLFIGSLLLSPVFGYLLNQLILVIYTLFKIRPNDVEINIDKPQKALLDIRSKIENSPLKAWFELPTRDLYRFIWVTFANKELRKRSESYWERYYTNINLIIVSLIGSILAIISVVPYQDIFNIVNLGKYFLILILIVILKYNNLKYLKICTQIENTWINAFSEKIKTDPEYFIEKLFSKE